MFSRLTEKRFWFRRESENFFFIEFTLLLQLLIYQNFFVFDFFMLQDVLLNRIQVVCILQVCRYHHYGFTLDDQRNFLCHLKVFSFLWVTDIMAKTALHIWWCLFADGLVISLLKISSLRDAYSMHSHTVTYPCRSFFNFLSFSILQVYKSI